MPGISLRMPVRVVAGRRQPEALAVRLLVRRQGQYQQGRIAYMITCGGWRQVRTNIHAKMPFIRELPFRTWRARSCAISVSTAARAAAETTSAPAPVPREVAQLMRAAELTLVGRIRDGCG